MKEIILASNNKGKLKEIKDKLNVYGINVISQVEAGCSVDVEETGTTFAENACLKAQAIYDIIQKPVISDDSGLEIDSLGGKPGVYSHRFAGENATDEDRIQKILDLMKDIPEEKRTARFKCVICYIDETGKKHIFEGTCEGKIGTEPKGHNGFGYNPIFIYNNDKTFAEMEDEDRGKISHRGKAIEKFLEYIRLQTNEDKMEGTIYE